MKRPTMLALAGALALGLASCNSAQTPTDTSTAVNIGQDGSVTYAGVTYTPEQIQARAAELDAQFRADTQSRMETLKAQARSASKLSSQVTVVDIQRDFHYNMTTGYQDDCFYLQGAIVQTYRDGSRSSATYLNANSTKVAWWRVKGYANVDVLTSMNNFIDVSAKCLSASSFFSGSRETGSMNARLYNPLGNVEFMDVKTYYGIIRSGEGDYANQGYSFFNGQSAVGSPAPTLWAR